MDFLKTINQRQMCATIFVLGMLAASVGQAANWDQFGTLSDGTKVSVDENSIKIDHDQVVKGWVRFDYVAPKTILGNKLTGHVSYRMANCENGRQWVVEDWGNTANSLDPVSLLVPMNEWSVPIPGSESSSAMDALCYQTKSYFGVMWDKIKARYEGASR